MARKRFHDKMGRRMGEEMSSGLRNRERMEASDYSMISEDHSAIATLPEQAIYKLWPKAGHYADFELEDNIGGIDEQMDADGRGMKKHKSTKKY